MTFTKVFKKKGDKVATENEETKEDTVDDKKNVADAQKAEEQTLESSKKADEGVVYAELDLQHSSPAPRPVVVRPEDDKTEYAEILHAQNNNK
ncbi:hypothetical protein O3M35_008488 [Rhynocoris fuscipes]|uniref:Uncharacterized protein n=1 Tax=Rhynocoris fuscipes TaxID=488301 RepID=A0AAW1D6H4_9HEMI